MSLITFHLFDMDGVLLKPLGYHTSLRTSVKRIGKALGAPKTELTTDEIAKFEALSVTNEWDSVAICTAVILVHIWGGDGSIRLDGLKPRPQTVTIEKPDFSAFLDTFHQVGHLPGQSAYQKLMTDHPWLNDGQQDYLALVLQHSRDIYTSPTLPGYQETVLGSEAFQKNYGLPPQLQIASYLVTHDQPFLNQDQTTAFRRWLARPGNAAGILTNRPCRTPAGYLSSPEAELGAKLVGLENLPLLGSGLLAWYAVTQRSLPDHTYLKPNPVHTLGLLQMILGEQPETALSRAALLADGQGDRADWEALEGARVVIYEDAAKGLQSGIAAREKLAAIGIRIDLKLIGVTDHSTKHRALEGLADEIIPAIHHLDWIDEDGTRLQ